MHYSSRVTQTGADNFLRVFPKKEVVDQYMFSTAK